jgi:hypothetical protein
MYPAHLDTARKRRVCVEQHLGPERDIRYATCLIITYWQDVGLVFEELMEVLLETPTISTLIIRSGLLTDQQKRRLIRYLPESNIWKLGLSGMRLNDGICNLLTEILPRTKISTLDISNNPDIGKKAMIHFLQKLPETNVSYLSLEKTDIHAAGGRVLAAVLKHTKLTTLGISQNKIGKGMHDLLLAIPESNVEFFDAASTGVSNEVCALFFRYHLVECNQLRTLYLDNNDLEDSAVEFLVDGLKTNTALRHLCLRENLFTKTGVEYIAKALKENNYLQDISIQNQALRENTEEEIRILRNAIKTHRTVRGIGLCPIPGSFEWKYYSKQRYALGPNDKTKLMVMLCSVKYRRMCGNSCFLQLLPKELFLMLSSMLFFTN